MSLQATPTTVAKRDYPKCDRCTRIATHFTKNTQLCDRCKKATTTRKERP